MTKTYMVAEMALREMVRRRSVMVILLLLPLAFYLSRRSDHLGQSIRFVCLGLGWALSTAALFAGSAARTIEPRLRLSGYRSHHLVLGRLAALWTVGALLSLPYFLLIRFDQHDVRYGAVALIMALAVAVAAPFGLALSAVLPREAETVPPTVQLTPLTSTQHRSWPARRLMTLGRLHLHLSGLGCPPCAHCTSACGSAISTGHSRSTPPSATRSSGPSRGRRSAA